MLTPERELQLHRFLAALRARLRDARDPEQAARSAMRDAIGLFEATGACLASVEPGEEQARLEFVVGGKESWDLELLGQFFLKRRPEIPSTLLVAPLRRRGRMWYVLGLRRTADRPFGRDEVTELNQVAATVTELIHRIDRERNLEVRSRIQRKIMEELRPKDLFYQILHGLRTLTGYDHSSALLVAEEGDEELTLVAEQIAWRKGKSEKIGMRLAFDSQVKRLLLEGRALGFDRNGGGWSEWNGRDASALAELFDYNDPDRGGPGERREAAMLIAPIVARDGVVGVLKIAACHSNSLGLYEARIVDRFVPPVSVAIRNSRRSESLQANLLAAERKNAMADLARGVAHDLNNALGGILPLVQQLREDSEKGELELEILSEDLREIERSMQVCRRIFGGMLAFARGAARGPVKGDLRAAVDGALTLLLAGFKRRGIACDVEVPEGLPAVRAGQSDLDQVFFNLMTNARDAMPDGGRLRIGAEIRGAELIVFVEDTGVGIPAADLARTQEPFFTTKAKGSGLGLSICRSILWGIGGSMNLTSREGEGTRVELVLPTRGEG
jgi:two-component system NtrC family sensor kinase